MLSRWIRTWDTQVLRPLLRLLARSGVTPNLLTLSSLIASMGAGVALAQNRPLLGAIVMLVGLVLDGIDGELARELHRESARGAFLDSMADHCGDFAFCFGLLWRSLSLNRNLDALLIFVALFGSVFGSQVRSRAGMLGIDTKDVGMFTRLERTIVLVLGLVSGRITIALWIVAIANNLSAFQRIIAVLRRRHLESVAKVRE